MKLYDVGKILIGILVFAAIAAFPFYYNIGRVNAKPEPKVDTPAIQEWEKQYGKKECVESKEFMRAEHMQLLNNWRDAVVRQGHRGYTSGMGISKHQYEQMYRDAYMQGYQRGYYGR